MRGQALSRVVAWVVCLVFVLWAAWLWHARKTLVDYVSEEATKAPMIPFCEWVPVGTAAVASLGLDMATPPPWTDTPSALIAFRTGRRLPWYVDIGVVAVAGSGVTLSADGGRPRAVPAQPLPKGKIIRLPLSWHTPDGVHRVTIHVAGAKPPSGNEQRWLGIAISQIRVCDSLVGT